MKWGIPFNREEMAETLKLGGIFGKHSPLRYLRKKCLKSPKMTKYVICAYRFWNTEKWKDYPLISEKDGLIEKLKEFDPEWVFFLDWSWIIPKEIINKYKCVCFHESNLPNFRGGSPVQNQIIRGIKKTKLTAFLMDEGLDTGDILLQEDLSLEGHIKDIFERVSHLIPKMIEKILKGEYVQRKQGEGHTFKRRTLAESELFISDFCLGSLEYLYNSIRMLEDPYPNAFLRIGDKKIVFKSAEFDGKIKVEAEIE